MSRTEPGPSEEGNDDSSPTGRCPGAAGVPAGAEREKARDGKASLQEGPSSVGSCSAPTAEPKKPSISGETKAPSAAAPNAQSRVHVLGCDCSVETLGVLTESSQRGLEALQNGTFARWHELARLVKAECEASLGGCWHVVCGLSFGAFFTHEKKHMALLKVGPLQLLAFRHG